MGKIRKEASAKHEATLSPAISEFLKIADSAPLHKLPSHLATFPKRWPFPRGDMYHWIKVLNRFDNILESFNTTYGLDKGPQCEPFTRQLLLKGDAIGAPATATDDILDAEGLVHDADRVLVEGIVTLSKILIDNCGNRSLYSSSNQLSNLLNTSSLSLLETTLRLGLRLAQRYSSSRTRLHGLHYGHISHGLLATHFNFDLHKLEKLALPFAKSLVSPRSRGKEGEKSSVPNPTYPFDLISLVMDEPSENIAMNQFSSPWLQYYDSSADPAQSAPVMAVPPSPVTPTPVRRTTSGLGREINLKTPTSTKAPESADSAAEYSLKPGFKLWQLSARQLAGRSAEDVAKEQLVNVPSEHHYELFQKIRVALALGGSQESRHQAVVIRLLAIANISHIYPGHMMQEKVLHYEHDRPRRAQLPYQLCDLLQPPGQKDAIIPKRIRTTALETLDALCNDKNKAADVCAALSVNVNHGVLSYTTRQSVAELKTQGEEWDDLEDLEWREALFTLLHTIPKCASRAGEGFVAAGILDILTEALTYRTPKAEWNNPRVILFLDVFVYNTSNAFQAFINAKGLDVISELLAHDVQQSLELAQEGKGIPTEFRTQLTDYQIPFPHQQTLKQLLKFTHDMMAITGGPFDRLLRNLIESSELLGGLRTIIQNPQIFGSNVWSASVDIFSSFIHNEPTSYAAIAEAGLTRAFLETITQHPIPEVSVASAPASSAVPDAETAAGVSSSTPTNQDIQSKFDVPELTPNADAKAKTWKVWSEEYGRGILPVAEAIAILPHAFGAICLNESGMQQFEASKALTNFFKAFICPLHVRALSSTSGVEVENIGNAFDELARHHPHLRPAIIDAVWKMLAVIHHMASIRADKHHVGAKLWTSDAQRKATMDGLQKSGEVIDSRTMSGSPEVVDQAIAGPFNTPSVADVEMRDAQSTAEEEAHDQTATLQLPVANSAHSVLLPPVSEYISVVSRFLQGFFGGTTLCTPFVATPGLELLLDLAVSPALPFDFAVTTAPKLVRVIQTLAVDKPHLVIPSIIRRMSLLLHRLTPFLKHNSDSSYFTSFVSSPTSEEDAAASARGNEGTIVIKALNALQVLSVALTKSLTPPNSRSASNPFGSTNFTDIIMLTIAEMGKLQSRAVWEIVHLQKLSSQFSQTSTTSETATSILKDDGQRSEHPTAGVATPADPIPSENRPVIPELNGSINPISWTSASVEHRNYMIICHLLNQLPSAIAQLFGMISKSVLQRRLADSYQKQHSMLIAAQIARTSIALLDSPNLCSADAEASEYFRNIALSLVSPSLIDKKTDVMDRSGPQLSTLVLNTFKRQGGITLFADYAQKFFSTWTSIPQGGVESKEDAVRRDFALNGLNHVLNHFKQFTNSKYVLESNQTIAMASRMERDRDRDKPEFFLPAQFLLELRWEVLRAIQAIWDSDELIRMESSVVQKIAEILRNIIDAQGEQGAFKKADKVIPKTKWSRRKWKLRNPDSLQRLMELDKSGDQELAREALYRCNENMSMAQEYCARYTRMKTLPRCPIPASDIASPNDNDGQSPPAAADGDSQVLVNDETTAARALVTSHDLPSLYALETSGDFTRLSIATENSSTSEFLEVSHNVTVEELDASRADLRQDLTERCLTLLNVYDNLTFELADLLKAGSAKASDASAMREDVTMTLWQSLLSFQAGGDVEGNTKRISACAHLFGIILQEKDFYDTVRERLTAGFPDLLSFLSVAHEHPSDQPPLWIASLLLILERLLTDDAQPKPIQWTPPSQDQEVKEVSPARLPEPIVSFDDKSALLDHLLEILPRVGKNLELGQAILRILVILTRDRKIASKSATKRNLHKFFLVVKQLRGSYDSKFHSAFMLVLRHLLEEEEMVKQIMRSEIQSLFKKHKQLDTTSYIRHSSHLVLRAPELFVEATNEMLVLARFDRTQIPQTLILKREDADATSTNQGKASTPQAGQDETDNLRQSTEAETEPMDMSINLSATKLEKSSETSDGVIQYLLSELLSYKDVEDQSTTGVRELGAKSNSDVQMDTPELPELAEASAQTAEEPDANRKSTGQEVKAQEHPIFVYRCFLLQCLTEMLQSYNRTKMDFINFSRKADTQILTPGKPRSGVLNYLLNVLIPTGTLQHPNDDEGRKKATTSDWAMSVLVSLCARTTEKGDPKKRDSTEPDDEPSLMFVRRFVIEHILKVYKDASASAGALDGKYAKLLSLADLMDRMLAGKPASNSYRRQHEHHSRDDLVPTQKVLARIMFEKNCIAALTASIADIDLNFPSANRAVKYILRPLKLLTYTAVDLSLNTDLSTSPDRAGDDEISSATSVSDGGDGGEDREETPDLFRNSTLGMFEPGHEDETSSESGSEEEDEEDMYGEEYADDMDYDEDERAHDDDVVSEEDEEMEGIGPIEGLSGDMGMGVEIEMDEDEEDEGDDEEDEDEEDSEGSGGDSDEHDDIMEVLEELADREIADEHDHDDWEDEGDEDANYEDHDGDENILDMGGHEHDDLTDVSGEDPDTEPFVIEAYPNNPDILDPLGGGEVEDQAIHDHEDVGDDDSEADEEDDEEDYDEEEIVYGGPGLEDDDSEMPPFSWAWQGRQGPYRQHRHNWDSLLRAHAPGGYRSHRPGVPAGPAEDGMNPLLTRRQPDPATTNGLIRSNSRLQRFRAGRDGVFADRAYPTIPTAEELSLSFGRGMTGADDAGPMSYISELINALGHSAPPLAAFANHHHHHGGAVHVSMSSFPGGGPSGWRGMNGVVEISQSMPRAAETRRHDAVDAASFLPQLTMERWMEESRLLFGALFLEQSPKVVNSILRLLVPPAIEAEKARKLEQIAAAKRLEEERARQRAEQEAKEKQEREQREIEARAAAEAEAERAATAAETGEPTSSVLDADSDAMEGVEASETQATGEPHAAAPPAAVRVMTTINGRQVDITHLGIDIAYLEALPEDMRAEVIAQQYAEHQSQASAAGEEPTAISREFLDALPPEIRRELLQQEAEDRRRREREEARRRAATAGGAAARIAEEMDPASFFASLDPMLRQTVLAETDDDMLAQLPPDIAAEARALGGRRVRTSELIDDNIERLQRITGHLQSAGDTIQAMEASDKPKHRTIVQMLDKAGIATLLRLMFLPIHSNSRHAMNGILSNACGNRQTRGEVVTGILSILQDGTADVAAVERSFAQLSLRAKQQMPGRTPQSTKRSQNTSLPNATDASPLMVVHQCLGALTSLTKDIPQIPQFFLMEQEIAPTLRGKPKGKGKGKESKASTCPLNALLALLDRSLIVENASVMEQLAALLQSITQPLTILLRKDKEPTGPANEVAAPINDSQEATVEAVPEPDSEAAVTSEAAGAENEAAPAASASTSAAKEEATKLDASRKARTFSPPEISEDNLRLIVNIYTARDCGAKAFRDALGTMSSLSAIPGARRTFGEELIKRARELGETINENLLQLIQALDNAEDEMEAQGLALAKFSPTGSDQAKLNRILTALDYIFEVKPGEEVDADGNPTPLARDGDELLNSLYEDAAFGSLWHQLSACLSATQQSENYFFNVATILLPLIEALMVVCKRVTAKDPQAVRPSGTTTADSNMRSVFFTFSNRHKKILNDLVRQNPKLMSGSFSVLVKNSSVLEFDNKRNFFTRRLHHRAGDTRQFPHPTLQLNVRRDQVFLDSYKALYFKSGDEIKYGKLNIRFLNEEGVDAGGVTREWFQVLARQMFNPDYVLFNPVASDRTTFHPNRLSGFNEEHLSFFKFIGRIIGKALYENRVLDCHFSRAVYKRILGKSVTVKDMETLDLDYAKSMEWILENDITDIIAETFSVVVDDFGAEEVIDLIPNGRNIPVTEENKHEYVRLVIGYRLTGSVQEQLENFLKGFHDIVPAELISIFDEGELELLISGMPDIDVDDWKNNTEYHNYNAASPQIQWLWRAIRSFDKEERAKLLQFVTGTGKVPLNGFKELEGMNGITRFSVHKDYGNKDRLPSSHTCFNQLDLPEYESYEALRKSLYTAMTTGNEYFGFA